MTTNRISRTFTIAVLVVIGPIAFAAAGDKPPEGFVSLFNGRDLAGWKVPEGDNGHWKVLDGVIDYDAQSESMKPDKSLWSDREFGDFVLRIVGKRGRE